MGIKTKFNPMGGRLSGKGDLSEWYYNTYGGQTPGIELKVYAGFGTDVYVPKRNTILQDYVNDTTTLIYQYTGSYSATTFVPSDFSSLPDHAEVRRFFSDDYLRVTNPAGTTEYNRSTEGTKINTSILFPRDWTEIEVSRSIDVNFVDTYYSSPFFRANTIVNLDLQGVKWLNNSMCNAFYYCTNLAYIKDLNTVLGPVVNLSHAFYNCSNFNQNIQIPSSVTSMAYTFYECSNFNQNIQIPNSVTNMYYTFGSCRNLNQNIQIPNSVTNMYYTFGSCRNLNQNIQIPNSVTDMSGTFSGCYNLNQNIQIPNSVTSMYYTFYYCTNLNQNIQIPNSVTNMDSTFYNCTNFNQNIQIPNSVTNMDSTFYNCTNFNQNIQIPNSVTNMYWTFRSCVNFNQNIQIPNSVTGMYLTFNGCSNLGSSGVRHVAVHTANLTNGKINNAFHHTSSYNISNQLTIIYPMRWINNANTTTYTAMVNATYTPGTSVGNTSANATENRNLRIFDFVSWEGYSTWTGNGTYWILNKWTGIGNGAGATDIKTPSTITSYDTFPVAIGNACYQANSTLKTVDLDGALITGTNGFHFSACSQLTTIKNFSASDTTSFQGMFYSCGNLQSVSQNSSVLTRTAHPYMPNSATSARAMYGHCKNITNFYIDSFGVTTLYRCWNGCNTRNMNVYISSPNVSNIAGVFYGYINSYYKNIHIYFKYKNGVATKTFNAFNGSAFYRNNATTHCYMYNLGTCPV